MAVKTIHTLAYKLLVDSKEFTKGMVLARGELAAAKRVMRETITPAEKIGIEFKKLAELLKKGVINQDVFNRKQAQLRKEYELTTVAGKQRIANEQKLAEQMKRGRAITDSMRTTEEHRVDKLRELNSLLKSGAISQETFDRATKRSKSGLSALNKTLISTIAAYVSFRAAMSAGRGIAVELGKIDLLGKRAASAGASAEFISGLEFTTGQISGMTEGQATKAIEKMNRRVELASNGAGEAFKFLRDELGFTQDELKKLTALGPEKTFFAIRDAMSGVTNEAKRQTIATAIFDDEQARIHTTMMLTNDAYNEQITLAKSLGAIRTTAQTQQAADAIAALTQAKAEIANLKTELAIGSSGAIGVFGRGLQARREFASGIGPGRTQGKDVTFGKNGFNVSALVRSIGENMWRGNLPLPGGGSRNMLSTAESIAADRARAKAKVEAEQEATRQADSRRRRELAKQTFAGLNDTQFKGETFVKNVLGVYFKEQQKLNASNTIEVYRKAFSNVGAMMLQPDDPFGIGKVAKPLKNETTDPMDSIAAGSAEAFKILNRTTTGGGELELAKQRTDDTAIIAQTLGRIETKLSGEETTDKL